MAIREQFTWNDFLRANPKDKPVKRTSPEGKKAFEAARKTALKKHLELQVTRLEKQRTKTTTARDALVATLKATKKPVIAKRIQLRVGQKDHAIAVIASQIERTKGLQKHV